jgi:hypothetical protein
VRFLPDYVRFGLDTGLTDDMRSLFLKRVRHMRRHRAGRERARERGETGIKSFERYADLYLGAKGDHARVLQHINERWGRRHRLGLCGQRVVR